MKLRTIIPGLICGASLLAAGALGISTAQANPILLYNTGVDVFGNPLLDKSIGDPHYLLVAVPSGSSTITEIRTGAGGFPIPPYIADDITSAWIGPAFNDPAQYPGGLPDQLIGPGGVYDYRITFNLAGLNPNTASISGLWATDNAGSDILLNGVSTGQTIPYGPPYSFIDWTAFSLTSGFLSGLNTIDFLVMNGNGSSDQAGPTALRVEMTGTARVPDGGLTVTLLGFALFGLEGLRRKLRE